MKDKLPSEAYLREQGVYRAGDEPERFKTIGEEGKISLKKIKLFVGPERSGKTRKAREIAEGKKVVWVDGRRAKILLKGPNTLLGDVTADTDLIVIDDVPSEDLVRGLVRVFAADYLTIHSQGRASIDVKRPEIIIVCAFEEFRPSTPHSLRRIEIVDFGKKEVNNG